MLNNQRINNLPIPQSRLYLCNHTTNTREQDRTESQYS